MAHECSCLQFMFMCGSCMWSMHVVHACGSCMRFMHVVHACGSCVFHVVHGVHSCELHTCGFSSGATSHVHVFHVC